mgnify:CR=1 FL=1
MDVYSIGKQGIGFGNQTWQLKSHALDAFGKDLEKIPGPYKTRVGGRDGWSVERTKSDTLERVSHLLSTVEHGRHILVEGSKDNQPRWMIHRTMENLGMEVVDAAISQLGVPYVWADANPIGDAGGPGAGFDCSGIVLWCYARVGITLPHLSEGIRTDHQVVTFTDRRKIRPGDMVFYHNSDRNGPWPAASHIAICTDKDSQIAAPTFGEDVQRQPIAFGANLVSFGRVVSVNGGL